MHTKGVDGTSLAVLKASKRKLGKFTAIYLSTNYDQLLKIIHTTYYEQFFFFLKKIFLSAKLYIRYAL